MKRLIIALLGLAMLVLGACSGVGEAVPTPKPPTTEKSTENPLLEDNSIPESEYTAEPVTLAPEDFELEIITTSQQCFGSAGCNVTFQIEVSYLGTGTEEQIPGATIIYEVSGGESGPLIDSFDLAGGTFNYSASEHVVSTPSAGTELTAEVTQIIDNGSY